MGVKEYVSQKKEQFKKFQAEQAEKSRISRGKSRIKEAAELKRLREQRIEAEGDANLRKLKQKEQARLKKAKSAGRPKQAAASGSGNLFGTSFGGGGSSDFGFGSMASSKKGSDPFSTSGNMFDMGFNNSKPKARAKKKSHKKSKSKRRK